MASKGNRLAKETSPYLLQHADNPVDWYPWGNEALHAAKKSNKPILLSIGYAACHWCHVMADESFSDSETAQIMNALFINIKVDREERPDLDKIYQTSLQILTKQHGGWPLTIFLTPEQIPFFGGTYFPKRAGFGRPSFKVVLQQVAKYYQENQSEIKQLSQKLTEALELLTTVKLKTTNKLDDEPIKLAYEQLAKSFDVQYGGFGSAPKFPFPTGIEFLLRADQQALDMATQTLTAMAKGGIYDQLGGGFFRYTVDEKWQIPHFEKMLYDNAQLLPLYANAFTITQKSLFEKITLETIDWALSEMQAPGGGFYATLNADSEGVEGKYHYWTQAEFKRCLTAKEYKVAAQYYGLNFPANFESNWHLFIAENKKVDEKQITTIKTKLLKHRQTRVRPSTDTKILTAWNALMIKGLTIAGIKLHRNDIIESAQKTLDFIYKNCWKNNRLYASYKDGNARFDAYLDDYAFLLEAIFHLLQVHWRDQDLQFAIQLAEILCNHFYDKDNGGFFFTADDHEKLIQRPKPLLDEATPAGNGVAAYNLLRLGFLIGEQKYVNITEKTLQMAQPVFNQSPTAYNSLLFALAEFLNPPTMIILRGENDQHKKWQDEIQRYYLPQHFCFAIPSNAKNLPQALQKPAPKSGINAYICQGHQCSAVIESHDEFKSFIENIKIQNSE